MAKGALPWITVSNVKVQRISMQHPVCHDKSMWARWDDLMLGPYHEQIALHHRLNGSLKSGVDELHVASHRLFHNEDYGNTAAYRYGLINENRKVAMGNLYCELVHQALTLAAIGDPVRLTVLKGALQLFFEGFPPAGYDGETVTVLCNPF